MHQYSVEIHYRSATVYATSGHMYSELDSESQKPVSEIVQPCGVCYDTGNDIEWEFRWSSDIMSAVRDSIYMASKTTQ